MNLLDTLLGLLVALILFTLFVIFLVYYFIYRKRLNRKFIRDITTEQNELFQKQTDVQLSRISDLLQKQVSLSHETKADLFELQNAVSDLEIFIQNSNEVNKTAQHNMITKLDKLIARNDGNINFLESMEDSFIQNFVKIENAINLNKKQSKIKAAEKPINKPNNNPHKTYETEADSQPGDEMYYLPAPDSNGFFWADKKQTVLKPKSFYIMNLMKNNPKRAYFSLLTNNEKRIKNALLSDKAFLKPVCDISGDTSSGKSISVIENGELQLINNKWTVVEGKKIKIKID